MQQRNAKGLPTRRARNAMSRIEKENVVEFGFHHTIPFRMICIRLILYNCAVVSLGGLHRFVTNSYYSAFTVCRRNQKPGQSRKLSIDYTILLRLPCTQGYAFSAFCFSRDRARESNFPFRVESRLQNATFPPAKARIRFTERHGKILIIPT